MTEEKAVALIGRARGALLAGQKAECARLMSDLKDSPVREVQIARVMLLTMADEPQQAIDVARVHDLEKETSLAFALGVAYKAIGKKGEALRHLLAAKPAGVVEAEVTKYEVMTLAGSLAARGERLPDVGLPQSVVRESPPYAEALRRMKITRAHRLIVEQIDALPQWRHGAKRLAWGEGRTIPRWSGERVGHLAVVLDGGSGDALLFGRYLPELASRADRLTVHAPAPVAPLLAERFPELRFATGDSLPAAVGPADAYVPSLALVGLLGRAPAAYLDATPLPREQDGMRHVGLCWQGSRANPHDRLRSIPPAELAPLIATPGVVWHSLVVPSEPVAGVVDHAHELRDFRDTARLVRSLDLVITVDSAVANLCGAIGRSDVVLLEREPEWRWGLAAPSPWFPTLRQVRQPAPGDWRGVVERVCAFLTGRVTTPH